MNKLKKLWKKLNTRGDALEIEANKYKRKHKNQKEMEIGKHSSGQIWGAVNKNKPSWSISSLPGTLEASTCLNPTAIV